MRLLACSLLAAGLLSAHDPISTKLTWTQEISRIVYRRCASCHRAGGSAPMALITYAESRPWAKAIKEQVLNRSMPPWGAVKGFGEFRNDPSLTQDEINRIAEWVEGGAPEGDPEYMPGVPKTAAKPAPLRGRRTRALVGPTTLVAIRPLASAESSQITAELPAGGTIPLLWLHNYKRSWNRDFIYREPILIPKGTKVQASIPLEFVVR
jgi:hypothetical protein